MKNRRETIRIVYCIDNMDIGGTELNAVRTAERLDSERFELSVVCFRSEGAVAKRYVAAGIAVHSYPITNLTGARTLREGIRFTRFLRDWDVDVVHCHDCYSNVFGTMWGSLARKPAIIASRRWWYPLLAPKLRVANIVSNRLADCVVANSPAVAADVCHTERLSSDRVTIIPNFVDEPAFDPLSPMERSLLLREIGVPAEALVIGSIARLVQIKDYPTLLRALATLLPRWPKLHLVLVGDGESRRELEALATRLGIRGHVHFAGAKFGDRNLHHLFDISVLCSISEGFPNTLIEAMAAGRPVVATAVGGIVDAVRDGETGLLIPAGQPEQLAAAIQRLLSDPEQRRALGDAGRTRARAEFHAGPVIDAWHSLYENLVARKSA